jgi:hypothetical protein
MNFRPRWSASIICLFVRWWLFIDHDAAVMFGLTGHQCVLCPYRLCYQNTYPEVRCLQGVSGRRNARLYKAEH